MSNCKDGLCKIDFSKLNFHAKIGVTVPEARNRLGKLAEELKKYGMNIRADSQITMNLTSGMVTEITLTAVIFDKPLEEGN